MKQRAACLLQMAAVVTVLLHSPAWAQNSDIAVVVSPRNAVSSLSLGDLRKIFGGAKRTWPGGTPIRLLVRPPGARERSALLHLLQMSESDYKRHWTEQVYRGESQSEPLVLSSLGMIKEAMTVYDGAIALIDRRDVKEWMKVVRIEGHLPGEENYVLR